MTDLTASGMFNSVLLIFASHLTFGKKGAIVAAWIVFIVRGIAMWYRP